jgi:hypothetical protein
MAALKVRVGTPETGSPMDRLTHFRIATSYSQIVKFDEPESIFDEETTYTVTNRGKGQFDVLKSNTDGSTQEFTFDLTDTSVVMDGIARPYTFYTSGDNVYLDVDDRFMTLAIEPPDLGA